VQKQQLIWFGHTNRIGEKRLPKEVLKWVPQEKSKWGWPRRGWRDDIREAMEARDCAEEKCYRREEWRLRAEKWKQLQIICIYIYAYNERERVRNFSTPSQSCISASVHSFCGCQSHCKMFPLFLSGHITCDQCMQENGVWSCVMTYTFNNLCLSYCSNIHVLLCCNIKVKLSLCLIKDTMKTYEAKKDETPDIFNLAAKWK
jgi:hypothetical protein